MAIIGIVVANRVNGDHCAAKVFLNELFSRGYNALSLSDVAEAANWMLKNKQPIGILIIDSCLGVRPGVKITPSGTPGMYHTSHPIDLDPMKVPIDEQLEQLRNPVRVWSVEHKEPTTEQGKQLKEAGVDVSKCRMLAIWSFHVNSHEAILRRIDEILKESSSSKVA